MRAMPISSFSLPYFSRPLVDSHTHSRQLGRLGEIHVTTRISNRTPLRLGNIALTTRLPSPLLWLQLMLMMLPLVQDLKCACIFYIGSAREKKSGPLEDEKINLLLEE